MSSRGHSSWMPYRRCRVTKDAALQKIERRKEENPNQIDKVPEEPGVLDSVGEPHRIRLPQLGARTPEIRIHHHSAEHVKPMQAGQCVVDGEEVVGVRQRAFVE